MTVKQVQKIIRNFLQNSGRGGFLTGTVLTASPLCIQSGAKLILDENDIYITENCIGLTYGGVVLRPSLKAGDGVILLSRPDTVDGVKYILIDRIQPYQEKREV